MNETPAEQKFWQLLSDNNLSAALAAAEESENPNLLLIQQIVQQQSLAGIESLSFSEQDRSPLLGDLIKLFLDLSLCQPLSELAENVLDCIYQVLPDAVTKLKQEANGYPSNPISGETWMNAANLRTLLGYLFDYSQQHQSVRNQLFIQYHRSQLTLAVMGHYKEDVGPDMIRLAQLFIADGRPDAGKSSYQAVINDFAEEIENYQQYFAAEAKTTLEHTDYLILSSLQAAYQGLLEFEPDADFSQQLAILEGWLKQS